MLSTGYPSAFHIMAKPHGPVCNLNCTYCYYLEKKKLYPHTGSFRMDESLLETFTRQYIESQDINEITFTWQGGEPALAGIEFFRKALAFQKKYSKGKKINNAFQTNGTLINEDWCRFLLDNNFLVGISVDGPREIHDAYRVNNAGRASFDDVMKSIELFHKQHVEFNTLTVVHIYNSHRPMEVYNFLKEIGSGFIQFIPIVERYRRTATESDLKLVGPEWEADASVTEWSVKPEDYGEFLIAIFDEWVRNDVARVFIQLFDVTLANWVGQPSGLCVFSETCGSAMVVEHNGDLYSCDHFVYPEYKLGNIESSHIRYMAQSMKQITFGNNKLLKLPACCINCEYRFACHGECPKHRFGFAPDGERGLSYLCKAYKSFFSYVHPYMQYMGDELAAKRPPANVMPWAGKYRRYR